MDERTSFHATLKKTTIHGLKLRGVIEHRSPSDILEELASKYLEDKQDEKIK